MGMCLLEAPLSGRGGGVFFSSFHFFVGGGGGGGGQNGIEDLYVRNIYIIFSKPEYGKTGIWENN